MLEHLPAGQPRKRMLVQSYAFYRWLCHTCGADIARGEPCLTRQGRVALKSHWGRPAQEERYAAWVASRTTQTTTAINSTDVISRIDDPVVDDAQAVLW